MPLLASLSAAVLATAAPDTAFAPPDAAPVAQPVGAQPPRASGDTTPRRRRRAVEVSDGYATRLTIHRVASYTMPPLFVAQYVLGDRLLTARERAARGVGTGPNPDTRTAHQIVAGGVAALFAVNTVTGVWNLVETRHQTEGRRLRVAHAVLMLATDAGFVATGLAAGNARDGGVDDARRHRNIALASMAPATVGAAMMWIRQIRGR